MPIERRKVSGYVSFGLFLALLLALYFVAIPKSWRRGMTPLGMSTGYSRDFAEIGTAADALRKKAHGDSGKIEALGAAESAELARLEVRRALLTESPSDYPRAALALDFARVANAENAAAKDELLLLAARLDLQYGRVGGVRKWLALLPPDAPLPELYALRAELAFVTGEYVVADREGRKSIAGEGGDAAALAAPAPDSLRWERLLGQSEREATVGSSEDAAEHARLAEESLPTGNDPAAVQARARYELRVGRSEFERGNYGLAEIHYGTAERFYPGYWKTRERQAELRGAQERYAEATALYEEIIETEPRPEWLESLGDLYAHVNKPDAAKPFQDRALIAYRASAARGEPLAYHHLARILSDVRKDPIEAVKWAKKDIEERPGFTERGMLAWALYRAGRADDAWREMERALGTGVRDYRLLDRAAEIRRSLKDEAGAIALLARAVQLNPMHRRFHVAQR